MKYIIAVLAVIGLICVIGAVSMIIVVSIDVHREQKMRKRRRNEQ